MKIAVKEHECHSLTGRLKIYETVIHKMIEVRINKNFPNHLQYLNELLKSQINT